MTVQGDIIISEKPSRVILGDCLTILPTIEPSSINLIVTDSPYNAGKDFANDSMEREAFLEFTHRWMMLCYKVLTSNGSFYCFINEHYLQEFLALAKQIFIFRHLIIWQFEPSYRAAPRNYDNRTEYVLFCTKSDVYTFNIIREPPSIETIKRWAPYADRLTGNVPYDKLTPSFKRRYKRENYDGNPINVDRGPPLGNVIFVRRVKDNDDEAEFGRHITQKPIELLEKFILVSSNEGDIVLDCFAGHGSTLIAAKKHHRRYLGIEIDKDKHDVCAKSLSAISLSNRL